MPSSRMRALTLRMGMISRVMHDIFGMLEAFPVNGEGHLAAFGAADQL